MTRSGLTALSTPELEALAAHLADGRLTAPWTFASFAATGFAHHARILVRTFGGLDLTAARRLLEAVLAERERPAPRLELVWTGPEAPTSSSRDTWIVVRQLFESARERVIVGGFSFDHGEEIFRPLHAVMRDHGVRTSLFVDLDQGKITAEVGPAYATARIDRFFRDNWPFGDPRPTVFYDPRTAVPGPPWVSLHAKCVVVDDARALVTSANFTDRGQTRNLEAGVLIEDAGFATKLAAQWRGLVSAGQVARYSGSGEPGGARGR
ncbi:MAG: DISARM system phospholipase D-like protein DrmC [Myxococcales bacterium]|nr:DISARM system phospholipase D-like protein DrmC [Myxococcales bacterium]